jgi:hypothetical protein
VLDDLDLIMARQAVSTDALRRHRHEAYKSEREDRADRRRCRESLVFMSVFAWHAGPPTPEMGF